MTTIAKSMLAVRVKAADNLCRCPACELEMLLRDAGHAVNEVAADELHTLCTAPVEQR